MAVGLHEGGGELGVVAAGTVSDTDGDELKEGRKRTTACGP